MFKIASIYTGFGLAQRVTDAIKAVDEAGECTFVNFADDGVLGAISEDGFVSEASKKRVANMVDSAVLAKPDLILDTCSSIGDAFDQVTEGLNIPVLRIDAPMAELAVAEGSSIVVVGSLKTTIDPSCGIVERKAKEAGKEVRTYACLLEKLIPVYRADGEEAAALYAAETIKEVSGGKCDVVMLAQASLTRFRDRIEEELGVPVLASIPICAEYIKKTYLSK